MAEPAHTSWHEEISRLALVPRFSQIFYINWLEKYPPWIYQDRLMKRSTTLKAGAATIS